tara:strand:+ start:1581 stop:1808 length:228 start_codon:yes stop_codon:yes gene_type:complete
MGGVARVFSKSKKRTPPVSAPERREETAKKTAPEQQKEEPRPSRGDRLNQSIVGGVLEAYKENTQKTLGVRNKRI